jgi:hypothetical protein
MLTILEIQPADLLPVADDPSRSATTGFRARYQLRLG